MKSSSVTSMHILMRRSSTKSTFHALAWHTTSRSRGLTNSDRSQNVFGSGSNPSEVKKRSPMRTISSGSSRLRLQAVGQREGLLVVGRRDQRIDVRPVLLPDVAEQMRRNRAFLGDDVAVPLAQLVPDVGVQRKVQRPELLPDAVEVRGKRVGRHVVAAAPHRAGVRMPERPRALVRELDEPRVVLAHRHGGACQPSHTSRSRSRVAVVGEDLGDLLDVEAVLGLAAGTELGAAVGPLPSRRRGATAPRPPSGPAAPTRSVNS